MEPKYKTPEVSSVTLKENANDIKTADQTPWSEFFTYPQIRQVVNAALENNLDLKTAHLNIELAMENYNIARGNLMPSISLTGYVQKQGVPAAFASFSPKTMLSTTLSMASYEVDIFGRLRSLKKSAKQSKLAQEEYKNTVKLALVTNVASMYLQYLTDQKTLELMQQAVSEKKRAAEIMRHRYENGRALQTEAITTEIEYKNLESQFSSYKSVVELDKNTLLSLIGKFDESLIPEGKIDDVALNEDMFSKAPSTSLLARPDIKQAEYNLKAANANIGAARAAFFPTITITGTAGYSGIDLQQLFDNQSWKFTPQISVPIFNGFKNKANLNIAHIQKKAQVIAYEKSIQTAFKETLDALTNKKKIDDQLKSYKSIVQLNEKSLKIAQNQYSVGIANEVSSINANINLLTAKQNLYVKKQEYLTNLITLYKVLGGGAGVSET